MISDEFIKSEMIAEYFIFQVEDAYKYLNINNPNECGRILKKVMTEMRQVLVVGDFYDIEYSNREQLRLTDDR